MNAPDLDPFRELVRQRSGLRLDTLAETCLLDAVRQRMTATEAPATSAYLRRVLADDGEFGELISLLTINETYFFREPGHLELLTERFLPPLLAEPGERPLRILSAGCSSGEEPYSIAIAIREKLGENACRRVSISACDIDRHALARARQARYAEYSFRATPPALRQRYFRSVRGNDPLPGQPPVQQLIEPIRRMVGLHALNLLCGQLPPALQALDVIFFRNVSIYFDAASRECILRRLHAAMREGAYLLLGAAETLANDLGIFRLREDARGFFFVKEGDRLPPRVPTGATVPGPRPARRPLPLAALPAGDNQARAAPSPLGSAGTRTVALAASSPSPDAHDAPRQPASPAPSSPPRRAAASMRAVIVAEQTAAAAALLRTGQGAAALERLASLRTMAPDDVALCLLESYALLLARRFAEADAQARGLLDDDPWLADAHVLRGLCAKWQGDALAAIEHMKTAAYSRPDCWPIHYYLGGLLYEAQPAKARRAYHTALVQLSAQGDPDGGLRLPLNLPVADLRLLCEQRGKRCEHP